MNAVNIDSVTATQLFKRDGSPNGWRYVANDGSVIRAKSTRLFRFAHIYSGTVNYNATGIGRYVSLSSKSSAMNNWVGGEPANALKIIPITEQ